MHIKIGVSLVFFTLLIRANSILVPSVRCDEWNKEIERPLSDPYITGDAFRFYADHVIDPAVKEFNPADVQKGDFVFVHSGHLSWFFRVIHSEIQHPYFLITHNHPRGITGRYRRLLEDPKIIKWFAKNGLQKHEKLQAIPIGLSNAVRCRMMDTFSNLGNVSELFLKKGEASPHKKKYLLYLNFTIATRRRERSLVFNLFSQQDFCYVSERKPFVEYVDDLTHSKFVLSPRGIGVDCYRTWEAIVAGCIPIVRSSPLNHLYNGLPVVIVDNWKVITKEFLEKTYKKMMATTYNLEKLYIPYWFTILDNARKDALCN